jgi:hypothetical protein
MFGLSTVCRDSLSKKIGVTNSEKQKNFSFLFFCRLFFKRFQNAHRETDRFFAASGVQLAQSTSVQFHYHRTEG